MTDVIEFRDWYVAHHGEAPVEKSVFVTCLCGHFHTYPKAAESILREMRQTGLVETKAGKVWVNVR